MRRKLTELAVVLAVAAALAAVMTWPMAARPGSLGRIDNNDGQLSIWNVAWVARTLVTDPIHVFDANIFYPHRNTLAYSESNLGAGILAIPAYWMTHNALAAHNAAVFLGLMLSATGMFYLVHLITCDYGAAAVAAIGFAFTPFVFAHTAHVQLMMTAGLPFSMFLFHRFTERMTPGRGAALGAVMAATALFCGYYGVFVVLMVGYASLVVATTRGLWTSARYWLSLAAGAVTAVVLVAPAFLPYVALQREQGFQRELSEAGRYASNWSDYFASAAHAHAWLLPYLPPWTEVSFPGFVIAGFGIAGAWVARRRHHGEIVAIYGGLGLLALWASFGPSGGLYALLYRGVPLFSWLRAPARFGLIVTMCLCVLAGATIATFARRFTRAGLVTGALAVVTVLELLVASNLREMNGFEPVYRTLAAQPRGPVIETPFYYLRGMFPLHAKYMLNSTTHWMPLVNGYSDYIPQDFVDNVMTLAPFPSEPALKVLKPLGVRYALMHMYGYNDENRRDVETRMQSLQPYFRLLYDGEGTRLYEIVKYPEE